MQSEEPFGAHSRNSSWCGTKTYGRSREFNLIDVKKVEKNMNTKAFTDFKINELNEEAPSL